MESASVNRVVVALLDGSRVKGFVYGFRATEKSFTLFPSESQDRAYARFVPVADCKAIFFVRTHEGDRALRDRLRKEPPPDAATPVRGMRMRVVFDDGEEMHVRSEAYSPDRLGFFAYPLDERSNNVRIFVVNASLKQVQSGTAKPGAAGASSVQERIARAARATALPSDPVSEAAAAAAAKIDPSKITIEQRTEAVLRLIHGETGADLSRELAIPEGVLIHWARVFVLHGKAGLQHSARGPGDPKDAEIAALRGRIQFLEAEFARRGRT
jgi:hypothetical protein